jgi:hypothetical protein
MVVIYEKGRESGVFLKRKIMWEVSEGVLS